MGYFYEVLDQFKKVHSSSNPLGMRRPDWSKLGELLWGERRGLIRFAPIVAPDDPGIGRVAGPTILGPGHRFDLDMAAVFLVNLSYPEWTGGWSTGPRLLVPLLPFAMLPVAALLAVGGRAVTTVLAILLALAGAVVILQFEAIGAPGSRLRGSAPGRGRLAALAGRSALARLGLRQPLRPEPDVSLAFPGVVKRLPSWAGWATVLPLVVYQVT